MVWLLHRIGIDHILYQLKSARWQWLVVAFLVFSTSNFLGALQWYFLLRSQHVKFSFLHVLSYYHVGLFFNNFLIGYVGGDALRIYDVARKSGDSTIAVSSVVFDRFIGFFTLTSMAMGVSFFQIHKLASYGTVYFIGVILALWVATFFLLLHENAGKTFGRLFKPLLPHIVVQKVHDIYMAINQFRHQRFILLQIIGISIVVQALRIVTHYCTALAVGVQAHVLFFFMFIPIVALFASLPISFGGIGVREQSGVTLFSTVGLAASRVVTFEFLAYIIGVVATLPGGIIFALRGNVNVKKPTAAQHASIQQGGASHE
ncbi:flippase-like domain-containing protein [candidate division KSB1 bacterium]|nr:flippase-like domain-containing protein [candidate division KSB1 bacterium]